MSLRDYFAGIALARLDYNELRVLGNNGSIAEGCYKMADAMLAERSKCQPST